MAGRMKDAGHFGLLLCLVLVFSSSVSDGRARNDRPEDVTESESGERGEGTPHILMKLPKEEHFRKRSKKGKAISKLETDVAPSTMQDGEEVVDLSKLVYISEDEDKGEEDERAPVEKERKLPELGRESPDALALDDNLIPGTNRDKLGFVRCKGTVRGKEETRKKRQSKTRGSTAYEEEDEDTFYRRVGRKEFKDEEAITKPNKSTNLISRVKALATFRRKQTAGKVYETKRQQEKGEQDKRTPSGKGLGKEQAFEDGNKVDVSDRVTTIGEDDDVSGLLATTALSAIQAERGPGPGHSVDSQDGPNRQEGGGHETSRSMREHETVVVEDLEHNVVRTHVSGYVGLEGDQRPQSQPAGSGFRKKAPRGQDMTTNLRIRRQVTGLGEGEGEGEGPGRGSRPGTVGQGAPLSNVSVLARLHRKRRVTLEEDVPERAARLGLAWREDMSDVQYYKLLEELYPDKKYMDYAKHTQEGTETQCMERLDDGLEFLHGRAVYWHNNWPVVRPATGYDPTVSDPSRPRSARTAMSQASHRVCYPPSMQEPGPRPHTLASGGSGSETAGRSVHKKRKSSARSARRPSEEQPQP